jgi:hypothetical protein
MKRIALALVIVAGLAGAGTWWYLHRTQAAKLGEARRLLAQVEEHLTSGSLGLAKRGLEESSRQLNFGYALPSSNRVRSQIALNLASARQRLQERLAITKSILADVAAHLQAKRFPSAQQKLADGLSMLPNDRTLNATKAYVERLIVQDFRRASDNVTDLASLRSDLPEELALDELVKTFSLIVEADRAANRERQSRIAAAVRSSIGAGARESRSFTPQLRGKVMIWDYTKKEVELAYELLPDDLRASSRDSTVTIFCVVKREHILRGYYSISRQPGYQEKMTIGVVYWPQRSSPGTVLVLGGEPAHMRAVRQSPEYGSSVKIKEWIEGLRSK